MGNRTRRRNRRAVGTTQAPVPVMATVSLVAPVATIPLNFNVQGAGTQQVELPSWMNGVAWKVTSVDCTVGCSSGISTCLIRVFGAVANNTTVTATEITARSKVFMISQALTQIKFKNARHVQHGASGSGVTIVEFAFSNAATADAIGVVNLSVKGGV